LAAACCCSSVFCALALASAAAGGATTVGSSGWLRFWPLCGGGGMVCRQVSALAQAVPLTRIPPRICSTLVRT
jgi:hypothetical protein